MGLSGRKVKQRISHDPRNLSWANDANKFGSAYLQKFGWDSSSGLGPSGEGRTKHISVYQKLDMLGIGADHKNSADGTAWKQGRDFENLLRKLNASAGNTDEVTEVAGEQMKVDGFVRPTAQAETASLDKDVDDQAEGEHSKPKKSKKRKHAEEEAEGEKRKRRSKKHKPEDESSGQERKSQKKSKKFTAVDEHCVANASGLSSTAIAVTAQVTETTTVVSRPHRAHRARHIASKGLAAKSATAISEILGIAPSLSLTTPSLTTSAYSTPIIALETPASESATLSTELKLHDLTTSSKSVMDYFREKLSAKSNHASVPTSADASAVATPDAYDDYDDRPRGGLGAARSRVEYRTSEDYDDCPRGGLGASRLSRTVQSLTLESTVAERFHVAVLEQCEKKKSAASGENDKGKKKAKKSRHKEQSAEEPMSAMQPFENAEVQTIEGSPEQPKKKKKKEKGEVEDERAQIGTRMTLDAEPGAATQLESQNDGDIAEKEASENKMKRAKKGKRKDKQD
ncbi:uncharacterized protein LAESUDRAFT_445071 [Laetiporus sulphureus 93-53]|uniref:PinX1-related protein 1 n=1 Tax=Laetiporus sulphureus 93-53 TaxID=1314785 RepID=A0A165C0V4_9APHY|nr:uncharacterized protein LAESUDRAFT_445071 [Laetiporus sulphureus 93-53]KZT01998.1 hypothetical protein LAESUDRAFT_445071 [Laetiporus sulphureus 93-53]